ncbi:MAG: outer membrane beta-barrel protein [Pseudomonadota bacterium]
MVLATVQQPLVVALFILALSHATPARAVEVAAYTGHRYGGSFMDSNTAADFEVADAAAYGLVLDFDLEPDKQIEVLLSRQNTYLSTTGTFTGNPLFDLKVDYFHIGGLYMMPDGERVRPFLSGTFGLTRMAPERADLTTENRLSLSLGGGAKIYFSKNLGLRLDVRAIYTALDADAEVFCSGGCAIKVYSNGFVQTEAGAALMLRF